MAGEKTEKATPKRKRDERKKGNVFLSREIVTVFSLLACFYSIKLLSPLISSTLTGSIRDFFAMGSTMETIVLDDIPSLVMKVFLMFFLAALPLMLVSILVAVIFTMAQTRMLVSTKAIAPKFDRINPLKGLKKMVSLRGNGGVAQISFKNFGHGSDCLECAFRLDPYPAKDDGYERRGSH